MSGGIKIAWYITTVITLEGLQANSAIRRFRDVRASKKVGQFGYFAVYSVDVGQKRATYVQEEGIGKMQRKVVRECQEAYSRWSTAALSMIGIDIIGGAQEQRSIIAAKHRLHQAKGARHGNDQPLWAKANKGVLPREATLPKRCSMALRTRGRFGVINGMQSG